MGKLLRNTTLRSVGRAIVSLLLFFCFSQGVWADDYTVYFSRPASWSGNTPHIHIWYDTNTNIVDNQAMTPTGASDDMYSCTFSTDQTSVKVKFNKDGSWNGQSGELSSWTPVSDTYFTCGGNDYPVVVSSLRNFSTGDLIYLLNTASYRVGNTDSQMWFQGGDGHDGKGWLHLFGGPDGEQDVQFILAEGTAETTSAVYSTALSAGSYAFFIITRNSSASTGPWNELWNQSSIFALPETNNRITGTTDSSFSSDLYPDCTRPTPSTGSASNITSVSATLNANITLGTCTPTFIGVSVYSDAACATEPIKNVETEYVANQTAYYLNVSGLSPLTTYYYKAYVKTSFVTLYASSSESFDTECLIITVLGPGSGDMKLCKNSGTMLAVSASGASDYTYQWYYNSTKSTTGATEILGATNDKYSPNILGTEYYYCVVQAPYSCTTTSDYSGAITYDSSKESPIITASATSVTNYAPVTLTVTGADVDTWNVSGGVVNSWYLYKESGTGAMFKGNVGSGSAVVYTVTGTTDDDCSSAVNITVRSNTPNCK